MSKSTSFYRILSNRLLSDPEIILLDTEISNCNTEEVKFTSRETSYEHGHRNKIPKLDLDYRPSSYNINTAQSGDPKVIYEVTPADYHILQIRAHDLLNEIFLESFDWPFGHYYQQMYLINEELDAIENGYPFRNSIFNVPLKAIPSELLCPCIQLPLVIGELIRSLTDPMCLHTIGAFRVESSEQKVSVLEQHIGFGFEPVFVDFYHLTPITRMSLLKRFFRNIPGQLINNKFTRLMYKIILVFDGLECLNPMIRWLLTCIPIENYKALGMVCLLLKLYSAHEHLNMMSVNSLSICWGPILFSFDMDLDQVNRVTKILAMLISQWSQFFLFPDLNM